MIKQDELIQNRYRVVRLLGSGGFGAVYLAEDIRLGRAVAIKEMDAFRLPPDERAQAEQLFEREARMLASLDHPGLTRIWDYFQIDQRALLVMEYVPGQTLRELLQRNGGPLDEPFAIEAGLQLCAVLSYLHSRRPQVIFRDLKPANVMVVPPGDPAEPPALRLIDFGIARLFKPEQTGDTLIIGTPGYAPPEQYGRSQTDQRSDIYSLGVTLHQLLSGQPPSSVPPPPLSGTTPALAAAIARATAPEPDDRYQSADELRNDLLAIRRTVAPQTAAPAPPIAPSPPPARVNAARPATPATPQPAMRTTTHLPPAPSLAPAPPRQSGGLPIIALVAAVLAVVGVGALGLRAFGRLTEPAAPSAPAPAATAAPPAQEWLLPGAPGKLAFGQRGQGGFDVWVATLDGQPPRRITDDRLSYSPAWSPDGAQLSLTHERDIYVGTAANPLQRRIDLGGRAARYPAWSPDGRQLALASSGDGEKTWQLTIVDLASGQVSFPNALSVGGIAWAPGRQVAFAAAPAPGQAQDIFVLDASGSARNITNTPDVEEDLPSWAPGGRQLACAASPAGADKLGQRQIVTFDADGANRAQLTAGQGPHTNPAWSPDGRWIAYLAQENSTDWQVWAMRADGSQARALTSGPERKFYLSWGK
jgi:hypothetical protein